MTTVDLGNFPACIDDVRRVGESTDAGPKDPTRYAPLLPRLAAANVKLPPLYRESVGEPFLAKLERLGDPGFREVLRRDRRREDAAGAMLDLAQAILQNGEGYRERATDAFQEVVSDLYDGFLSAEDRRGVKPPDRGVIAPLVKWGNPHDGPYTWPVAAMIAFRAGASVVSLPPANARRGLLSWAALGHETAGHDVLDADIGLRGELAHAIETSLRRARIASGLPGYWSDRIDETAADVMGILNMGPAAAIGMVGFMRGMNAAWYGHAVLDSEGPEDDSHPADVLRGFLAAATVRRLHFSAAAAWGRAIEQETLADVKEIVLAGRRVPTALARRSAGTVAAALVGTKVAALEHHALGEIQNWRDRDEGIVARLRGLLESGQKVPAHFPAGVYAAHAVAAAVTAALAKGGKVPALYERMQLALEAMHDANPSWGPLFVAHPGDMSRHLARIRRR